jgi:hypothetical protein
LRLDAVIIVVPQFTAHRVGATVQRPESFTRLGDAGVN